MALHALLYCERLFYLEEVEEIRVADAAVYAGRELHESLAGDEEPGGAWEEVELASPSLGIFGKVDCLRRRDGEVVPYEHKRGRCRRGEDQEPTAWPTDRVQAVAYAMLLEEAIGRPVPEARVRYHADGVTVRVPVDDAARAEVSAAVARARQLRKSIERPPVTENEKLCRRCSLAPVCLPEEVRQDREPGHQAVRLFPPDEQRTSLHVLSDGATVCRSGDRLVVRPREGAESKHASHEVSAVLLHGSNQITTQAIRLCVERDVAVHWVSAGGRHVASLTSTAGQVQRRVRQYQALADSATRLRLAKQLVRAKIEGQHRYLLRATRGADNAHDRNTIRPDLVAISDALAGASAVADVDTLRGHEGDAAVHYFSALRSAVSADVPEPLRYAGRSRRPTLDRFSAILNFGYALLQTAVMRAILAAGLEPALGFYHTPRSAAHPLVLDLMELFRCPLWDLVVVGSLNRGQWDPAEDFMATRAKFWLSDSGRRKAIGLFEERLRETWKHPVVNYSLSYARTIELEARLLEKEWTGEPGLFARMRLR
ncbi:MAG TPA: type I-MYXAN CRISPR-associated endonuclease Cas1 [Actinospica sp.]|nr:type I-MYXAN CRISPR-associated endonuclease Cas1 [Actinospica sp.]